jgi:hypothetical protein
LHSEKVIVFENLSTIPFIISGFALIPLYLPVRPPHAEPMMDPGEIRELIELMDAFQHDIPGGDTNTQLKGRRRSLATSEQAK